MNWFNIGGGPYTLPSFGCEPWIILGGLAVPYGEYGELQDKAVREALKSIPAPPQSNKKD